MKGEMEPRAVKTATLRGHLHPYFHGLIRDGRRLCDSYWIDSCYYHTWKRRTLADDFLGADALLFLISSLLSYWALRFRGLRRMHRLERIADAIFIVAMIGMVVVCALITYTISAPARSYLVNKFARGLPDRQFKWP